MPFTEKCATFLRENRRKNNREWYLAHKDEYKKYVLDPMIEFVEKLSPAMLKIDKLFVTEAKVDKTISRVYRDTRFSKDKYLYRENVWCSFYRDKSTYNFRAGFYFGVEHDSFVYGFGYYDAPPEDMNSIRQLIIARDKEFIAALKAYKKQDVFLLAGDEYKRNKYPDEPEEIAYWLNRKSIYFMKESYDLTLLYSPDLYKTIAKDFMLLAPIYKFFIKASLASS